MRAATLLSGGMDSATVLYSMINMLGRKDSMAISFRYPSKHNEFELEQAKQICNYAGVSHWVINLSNVFGGFNSCLLKSGGEIPEGHYESKSMADTVVPCRNLIFAGIAAGWCESRGIEELWMGIHSGDHAIYPDCRPDFFVRLSDTILYATDQKVRCVAPFLNGDKTSILKYGFENGVPYHLTRTCYKDQGESCGKCGACQERLEAFANHSKIDPVEYE